MKWRVFNWVLGITWCVLLFLIVAVNASCANTQKPSLQQAVQATVVASDLTYGLAVELCDERERQIIARPPTTLEQDKEDLARVREICDRIFTVFENARRLNPLISELEHL